jgi:hypothetical protein
LLTADYEGNVEYQAVTSLDEMNSVPRLTTLLANLLVLVASRSLQGPNRCPVGMLAYEVFDNSVSEVLAIIRL